MGVILDHVVVRLPLGNAQFVAWGEATLDASCFFLTTKHCYYAEGGWDLEAEVP
jgi:hypothetical protein